MRFLRIFPVLICLTILGGCASKYPITYNSEPKGAAVICNGVSKGYTPTTLYYQPDESSKKQGVMKTVPCKAIWSSGAKQDYSTTWDLKKFPKGVMQTVPRPDVPGYSQDAEFALNVENMKSQRKQANAAQNYNNGNTPKACKKFGDLSGQLYYFQSGFCPYGYY